MSALSLTPHDEFRIFNLSKAVHFAIEGFRSAILINGGAAIAILAFASSSNAHPDANGLKCSLFAFGAGALLATFGLVIAYIAQLFFSDAGDLTLSEDERASSAKRAGRLRIATAVCFVLSVLAFVIGVIVASSAIFPG